MDKSQFDMASVFNFSEVPRDVWKFIETSSGKQKNTQIIAVFEIPFGRLISEPIMFLAGLNVKNVVFAEAALRPNYVAGLKARETS